MGDAAAQALPPRMSYPSEPQNEHSDAGVSRRAAVLEEMLDEANPGASAFADECIANADEHWVAAMGHVLSRGLGPIRNFARGFLPMGAKRSWNSASPCRRITVTWWFWRTPLRSITS
jgi:hypothetical protein